MRTRAVDFGAVRDALAGRCFICELLAGNPGFAQLYRYVLVAPRELTELARKLRDAIQLSADKPDAIDDEPPFEET